MDNDLQKLLLDQLRVIADEVKHIPDLQARLNALDKSTREMSTELRARDQTQQQMLDGVRLQQSETMAAIAGVSSTVSELKFSVLEQAKRLATAETQVKATFDAQLQGGRRLREMESKVATLIAPDAIQGLIVEMEDNRPWINGIKWFLRILFGLLATAAGLGMLWLLAQSILGTLGG